MHRPPSLRKTLWAGLFATLCLAGSSLEASSHREAPFIAEHPKLDGTDFYFFRSYESGREDFVTLIANYQPLQDAYGGPNYFALDPEALYEIHIENTGDAQEDLTFQFSFQRTLRDLKVQVGTESVSVPLTNIGPVSLADDSAQNVVETFTLTRVLGGARSTDRASVTNTANGSASFRKPLDYIGEKTLGNSTAYESYARAHVYTVNVPGCSQAGSRVFVGQRAESFPVNLGTIFDLVNTDPNTPTDPPIPRNAGANALAEKNITTLALELPISCLNNQGNNPILGAWTTASLRQGRALNPSPRFDPNPNQEKPPAVEGGAWTQVSRLGMPLVNEVVIGLKDKDRFNASHPQSDSQFATYVTHPSLPVLLQALFGVTPPTVPRNDLVQVFLTGVPGLNQNGSTAEMLRLNTATTPVQAASQNDLGVLAGDNAGFPNGRRPGDDVVDIALRVVMGALLDVSVAPSNGLGYTDGATLPASTFQSIFPYLNVPRPGSPGP